MKIFTFSGSFRDRAMVTGGLTCLVVSLFMGLGFLPQAEGLPLLWWSVGLILFFLAFLCLLVYGLKGEDYPRDRRRERGPL